MAVGKQLKERRNKLNLSIEEAERETKIRKKYLRALEEDNYEEIPGLVYAKAFLKTYSSFLGLDQEEIIEEFERWRHLEDVDADLEGSRRSKRRRRSSQEKSFLGSFFSSFLSFSPRTLLILFVLLLIAGGVGYNFVIMNGGSPDNGIENEQAVLEEEISEEEAEEQIEEEATEEDEELALEELDMYDEIEDQAEETDSDFENEETIEEEDDMEADITEEEDIQPQETTAEDQEVTDEEDATVEEVEETTFNLTITETSWVRIIVDGNNVFEGTLDSGTEQEYQPEENLNIRTGNAGGVEIVINEEDIGALGETGEVIEREFEF